ncbi:hypothetical protein ACFC7A_20260 [Streptomyces niveus]|uniref:hypothetical protein n=1 Tax=Streptomyces niveus TaxID=193462 RepID=UPI0035D5CB80
MTPLIAEPSSSIDLFDDTVLDDPYPLYEALRGMGPAVWLNRHDMWFIGGYEDVRTALHAAATFSSENGIALTDAANRQFLNGTVLVAHGMRHVQLRRPLSRQLAPRAMKSLVPEIGSRAARLAVECRPPPCSCATPPPAGTPSRWPWAATTSTTAPPPPARAKPSG